MKHLICFINKADLVDEEMLELVELEMRELLSDYGFDHENTPFVVGSALSACEGSMNNLRFTSNTQLLFSNIFP